MGNDEINLNAEHERLLREAGLRPLSPTWAKLEILIGLAAAAIGLLCGVRGVQDLAAVEAWPLMGASVLLQTLGGYLALAATAATSQARRASEGQCRFAHPAVSLARASGLCGHRSYLYQSQNKLAAYLAAQLRKQAGGGSP